MDNLFFLEAKCGKTGKLFYPRYDLAADDCWTLTYGQEQLPAGQKVVGDGGTTLNISRMRVGPQYKCPHCGNTSYVRCGACGQITCHSGDESHFSCAHCSNEGEIKGSISNEDMKKLVRSSGAGQG